MDRIFPNDCQSKRERVEATLAFQPVDRIAIHEQLSYNPGVISLYTGREIEGFDYSYDDICTVIRKTLDACFPPVAPLGTDRVTDRDGKKLEPPTYEAPESCTRGDEACSQTIIHYRFADGVVLKLEGGPLSGASFIGEKGLISIYRYNYLCDQGLYGMGSMRNPLGTDRRLVGWPLGVRSPKDMAGGTRFAPMCSAAAITVMAQTSWEPMCASRPAPPITRSSRASNPAHGIAAARCIWSSRSTRRPRCWLLEPSMIK